MSGKIRGEYWIVDGRADFADGDVGDQNHEMIALNSVAADHLGAIYNYARDVGLDRLPSLASLEDEPLQSCQSLLKLLEGRLGAEHGDENRIRQALSAGCEIDPETLSLIMQDRNSVDPRLYVMRRYGWIAVRSNNIEVFGYDQNKRREIVSGVEEILDQEGIEEPDDEIEFSLYDHKTGRSSELTLADMKGENQMRPQTLPTTTYNRPMFVPADRSRPMGSQSPRSLDAITRSAMATSESTMGFRAWMAENCGPFMIRRAWPELVASGMEAPGIQASRRSRRGRRR